MHACWCSDVLEDAGTQLVELLGETRPFDTALDQVYGVNGLYAGGVPLGRCLWKETPYCSVGR